VEAGSCKGDAANAEGNREAGWTGKRVMSFCELDEIAREGARRILIEALKAEVDDYPELIDVLDPRWSPSRQPLRGINLPSIIC
jgi:hypothetical protein